MDNIPHMEKENIYKILGESIRNLRKSLGITQEELSFKAKISLSFLSHIERGTKKASLKTIQNIAAALGVSVDRLFQGKIYSSEDTNSIFARKIESIVKDKDEEYKKILLKVAKFLASKK